MGSNKLKFGWLNENHDLIDPEVVKSASVVKQVKPVKEIKEVKQSDSKVEPRVFQQVQHTPTTQTIEKITSVDSANSISKGLNKGWTRHTIVLNEKYLSNIKALSYWANLPFYEVLDEILNEYFENKVVKPIPNKSNKEKLTEALTGVNR